MAVTFLRPLFLLLTPAIAAVWWLPVRARDRVHAALRSSLLAMLILALAQPALLTSDRRTYSVFVVDDSASVSPAQRERAAARLADLRDAARDRAVTSLVVVGDPAERAGAAATDPSRFGAAIDIVDPNSPSSIGAALAAAARQIPDGAHGVIHLFSDGLSTDRRWATEVQQFIERGIVANTYDLATDPRDVYPAALRAGDLLRVGQTARVEVDVVGAATGLRVRLVGPGGEEMASSAPLDSRGRVTVPLTFEPRAPGFLTVTAQVIVPAGGDADPGDNELSRPLAIQDPLRLLYLGDRERGGAGRIAGLLGRGFDVTDASGQDPSAGTDLQPYDLVLLDDRPASRVPAAFQDRLADAVSHQGLGLLFSGGKSAFGTGGYDGTPVSTIVPVDFVQRTEKRDPSTALAIIIDTSGSMTGTRIELAKQVARLAVRRLKSHDRIGIVEFYGNKHWALPLQSAANKVAIDRAIGRMQAIGGTVLMPALEEAYYGLKNVETRYKHIVVITDAGVETADFESMIRQMAKDGINVSTVLVGSQAHNQLMVDMASWGKGRFYAVADRYNLPELILKQPSTMKLPAYKTGAFTVQSRGGEGWWSDIDRRTMPALDGYVETTIRPGAESLMEVEGSEDPILASWRYGLGRVTALTTEPVGEGTHDWADWKEYGRLLARIATRTADDTRLFDYRIDRRDQAVTITARRDSRDTTLYPEAALLDETGAETGALPFHQVTPGQFAASLVVDPRSTVRVLATAHRPAAPRSPGQPTRLVSAVLDDVSPERQVDPERRLDLEALAGATGGRYADVAAGAGPTGADAETAPPPSDSRASLAMFRLWPLLLAAGLLLYLSDIVYRRWPRTLSRGGA